MTLQLAAYGHEPAKPSQPPCLRAPGAGRFEISRLALSAGGQEPTLTARIGGRNIAYIYTEVLLKDDGLDRAYGPVVREHILADRNKETGGISHPVWDDPVDVAIGLRPSLRVLTDGADSAFCFSVPAGYGDSDHRLEGLYAPAHGTAPLRAVLTFDSSGETKSLLVRKERGKLSTPRAVAPTEGDRFTPFAQVLTPSAEGGAWETQTALSTPLTFRDRPLRVVTETPLPGQYLVGLLVQDLDGGFTRKYVPLTIG
jgi:hypothetical protein